MRRRITIIVTLAAMLAGCVSGGGLTEEQRVGTAVAGTQMAQTAVAGTVAAAMETEEAEAPPEPAVTSGPGDVPSVTDTPIPTSAVESTTQVSFAPGGTRAAFDGNVDAGGVDEYIVRASEGQILQVTLSPPSGSVYLDIRGADGSNLIPDGAQWTSFWSSLSTTQDYHIKVISGGAAQAYSINITIPAMIYFATGESDKTINGHVGENAVVDYLLYAATGQELHLTVTTPGVQVALSVTGMNDGQPYLRYVAEETDWTFTLPATQYYKISVVTIGPATDFTLYIEVE